jgi:multiple sugar transport system permease protein
MSLLQWDIIHPAEWVGLQNYTEALNDPRVMRSVEITFKYALMSVPLNLVVGFSIALLMNVRLRGMHLFRTLFFLPALIGGIPQAVLFTQLFSRRGVFNQFLGIFGIDGPAWVADPDYVLFGVVLMALWGAGSGMIIYLAGLADIPDHLYAGLYTSG